MTMERELARKGILVPAILPWLLATVALVVYMATLNRWISLAGLPPIARASGLTWGPELYGPVYYVLTYPFRWLPVGWVPVALNLFSAVCAFLTLALLARSVALLPHDRTHEQRQREHSDYSLLSLRSAWIPPVLAVAVCGLQLTFWENATAASSEMLDLLLFAYAIRCLLEYRLDNRLSWLTRASFVYGAAMTSNWAMIAFLPAFLMAQIWIMGAGFFNLRFLTRMFLFGVAGLSFYLVLPLTQSITTPGVAFWDVLVANLSMQKSMLSMLPFSKHALLTGGAALKPLWILGLTSLVPILIIGIRWPSFFGDISHLGITLTTWILHLAHAVMLGACIWVAFDPAFSPRNSGVAIPFLTIYYLGALCVGYLAGYFLLVFIPKTSRFRRNTTGTQKLLHKVATAAVWALLVLTPAALVYKNIPQIKMTNGPAVKDYAARLVEGLPERAVVLSDDPRKTLLFEAMLARTGKTDQYLPLDTQALPWPQYHTHLKKRFGANWDVLPEIKGEEKIGDVSLIGLLASIAEKHPVYYLHPSFGYYFEYFYQRPHGLVYELKPYPTNSIVPPKLTDAEIAKNEAFWTEIREDSLGALRAAVVPPAHSLEPDFRQRFMQRLHLKHEPNATARLLASFYSRSLNFWGVELQRAGRLDEAAVHFASAFDVNPDNFNAELNLEFNELLRKGERAAARTTGKLEDQFGKFRDWQQVIAENGPFDDPTFCFEQGRVFASGRLYRQAAQEFYRVTTIAPDHLLSRLWLAQLCNMARMPDEALKLMNEINANPALFKVDASTEAQVVFVNATAHFTKNDPERGDLILNKALAKNPKDENLLAAVVQVSIANGRYSNALTVVERLLKLRPDEETALVNKGYLHLQLGNFDEAISALTRVLSNQTTNHSARLNRAIAYLRAERLDEAKQDYEVLLQAFPNQYQIYYGLGEVAWRKKDTNAAIRYYELYLTNSVPHSEETKFVGDRLKQLKSGPG